MIDIELFSEAEVTLVCDSFALVLQPAWSNPDIPETDKSLPKVLTEFGMYSEDNVKRIQIAARSMLYRFFRRISIELYLLMEQSTSLLVFSEQAHQVSFCRMLMNIPPERQVTQFDADRMLREIDRVREELGNPGPNQLLQRLRECSVDFFGIHLAPWDMARLEEYIRRLEVSWGLHFTYAENGAWKFIFGEIEWTQYRDLRVAVFIKEWARSPFDTLSTSGLSDKPRRIIFVRRESASVIWSNKWARHFEGHIRPVHAKENRHPYNAIKNACKERCLAALGITSEMGAHDNAKLMISLSEKTIIWNQAAVILRSHAPNYNFLPKPTWILVSKDDGPVGALTSMLADWWPSVNEPITTMPGIVALAAEDSQAAEAVYWMYLSDYWFVSEDEPNLLERVTYLSHALMLLIARRDMAPDIAALSALAPRIYKMIQALVDHFVLELETFTNDHQFSFAGTTFRFEGIQNEFKSRWKQTMPVKMETPPDMKTFPGYSDAFWKWLRNSCPCDHAAIEARVQQLTDYTEQTLLEFVQERAPVSTRVTTLKEYVIQRHRELDHFVDWAEPDYPAIVMRSSQGCVSRGALTKALETIEKIMKKGRAIDLVDDETHPGEECIDTLFCLFAKVKNSGTISRTRRSSKEDRLREMVFELNSEFRDDFFLHWTVDRELLLVLFEMIERQEARASK
jgi:hypothetical protein